VSHKVRGAEASAGQAFVDADLLSHERIWAAAGTPNALFPLTPDELLRITGGRVASIG
jgi:prolyl-tRNA editing enzyme YbaK/EbsC (Cys-tRNA(Pro) deacylase)